MSEFKLFSVKKFYFIEYFYILLKSVEAHSTEENIFNEFLILKQKRRLGLSRYKKLTQDTPSSPKSMVKYKYTFKQVLAETEEYLLIRNEVSKIVLTDLGKKAIQEYEQNGYIKFNELLFSRMEKKHGAFRYLLNVCYQANPEKSGLLIFPIYSPYRLDIKRASIKTSADLRNYFRLLKERLESDIDKYLGKKQVLDKKNEELLHKLEKANFLPTDRNMPFQQKEYTAILKRTRDFWLKYFLQDLYHYEFSLSSFDIWAYRGKQIGLLQITEFYPDPNFSGRIVYPLSILNKNVQSKNFYELHKYSNGEKLYLHKPSWENEDNREEFLRTLHKEYLDIRRYTRSYFVNLPNVREKVCYALKIPEYLFDLFLGRAYHEKNEIQISLEGDKLPEETNAMYLKRTPVMVDGKYRNIIAIDLA